MSRELDDWFASPWKPRGSAQCPKCGRFCRIVRVNVDLTPGDGGYVMVDCPDHGTGIA